MTDTTHATMRCSLCGAEHNGNHTCTRSLVDDLVWRGHVFDFTKSHLADNEKMSDERSIIRCKAIGCIHNLARSPLGIASCNLKFILIDEGGQCDGFKTNNNG